MPVDITLGDGDRAGENSASFNIMGAPSITHGQGYNVIKLNAVLNNVPFLRRVVTGLYEGPSNQVLQKIAGEVGLKFQGDPTGDAMVWLPNNKTLAGFVRSVVNHGWVGAGSCMMVAVNSASEMLYRNVMQPQSSNETFGYLEDGHVQIVDWDATSSGLMMNNNRGYGSTSVGYGMDGVLKELNKITFNLFSSFLSISTKNSTPSARLAVASTISSVRQVIRTRNTTMRGIKTSAFARRSPTISTSDRPSVVHTDVVRSNGDPD
ncbi:hypothetical protein [Rhizobium phage RHEph12]|nr:hypothetical protein [Rhizobium phage RHEph12]